MGSAIIIIIIIIIITTYICSLEAHEGILGLERGTSKSTTTDH